MVLKLQQNEHYNKMKNNQPAQLYGTEKHTNIKTLMK